jgi:hypothetical protein
VFFPDRRAGSPKSWRARPPRFSRRLTRRAIFLDVASALRIRFGKQTFVGAPVLGGVDVEEARLKRSKAKNQMTGKGE